MRSLALALVASAFALSACSSGADDGSSDQAATAAPISYVGRSVLDALQAKHAASRGKTWDFSTDNALDEGWVLQTPLAEYWGKSVSALPVATECTGEAGCDADFGLLACS